MIYENTINHNNYKKRVIETFDEMASTYQDNFETGALRVLAEVVTRTLRTLVKEKHHKILDAGGGNGKLGLMFAREGHDVTVVDISSKMIDLGRSQAEREDIKGKIEFIQGDLEDLFFLDSQTFDFIICEGSVISFLSYPHLALKEFYRLLKTDGQALLCVQNRIFFMWLAQSVPIMKSILNTGRVYPQINAGADYKCSSHSYTPNEIADLVRNTGFLIERMGSRYMVANRFAGSEERLDSDIDYFEEVVNIEMKLAWDPDFIGLGRIITIVAEKK
ncbi:MAG: class I SAM-dependent methyltransferase [Clostridia bacterium]